MSISSPNNTPTPQTRQSTPPPHSELTTLAETMNPPKIQRSTNNQDPTSTIYNIPNNNFNTPDLGLWALSQQRETIVGQAAADDFEITR